PLPNAAGTRGRIDILARDIHDSWVVVELKRSDKAARDAIHEVAKYTELLRREKGLRADRIRSIVVATTWSELLVPVSNFARDSSHDVRGYELTVGSDGVPTGARRVELLAAPSAPRTTPVHFIFHFFTEADREAGWQQIVDRAAEVGAADLLAADFRRRDGVGSPRYGLYFAVGKMSPDAASEALRNAAAESDESEGVPGYPLEYEALCHILKHVFGASFDQAGPGTLRQIQDDPTWEVEGYRSAGAFGKLTVWTRRDLFRELNGDDGFAEVHYFGTARTTDRGRWPVFLTEYENSLASNEVWRVLVRTWLADVHASGEEAEVALDVFNPCDLVTAIVHGWPDHTWPLMPKIAALAMTEAGPQRAAMGALYWDGRAVPDIARLVELCYREPTSWLTARAYGDHVRRDLQLIELLGLRYVLVEHIDEHVRVWLVGEDGSPRVASTAGQLRAEGWVKGVPLGMDEFFAEHRGQLRALATRYRYVLGLSPSLPELSAPDTAQAELGDDRPVRVRHTEPGHVRPPVELDLEGCSVPARKRAPDTVLGQALVTIADLDKSDRERSVAWQVCRIRGMAAVIAADELLGTLSTLHDGTDVRPGRAGAVDVAGATRSEHIHGICYVVGAEGLRVELRRRAAVSLVMLCGESGYREARRLLGEHDWSWLPSVVERDSWATVLATYVVADLSAPSQVRGAVAALIGL
ncbi:MAG TPA: endonuclease NucS domain-containing protein, partial [Kribbella sp.]|nr:endonuclease NucS domain-containing protein [Kribbella sp.]